MDYIIAGDKIDKPVRLLCSSIMEELIEKLKGNYDYVILDTPSISVAKDSEILIPFVDKYVIVSCMNMTKKKQLFDGRIELADYENKYAGIIINKMDMVQYKSAVRNYDYFSERNLAIKKQIGIEKKGEE